MGDLKNPRLIYGSTETTREPVPPVVYADIEHLGGPLFLERSLVGGCLNGFYRAQALNKGLFNTEKLIF